MLRRLLVSSDVVAIQESHGNTESANELISTHDKTHDARFSQHHNPLAGGNFLFIKKDILGKRGTTEFHDILPGRANGSISKNGGHSIEVINVHNFDLKAADRRRLFSRIALAKQRASDDTMGKSIFILLGDFNFLAPGEAATKFGESGPDANVRTARSSDPELKQWSDALADMTEILQPEPTRLGMRTDGATQHANASRIDRVYVSTPP